MSESVEPSAVPIHCAWCDQVMGYSDHHDSHGICDECFEELEGVAALDAEELDRLPYGVIELDQDGIVRAYNAAEQALAGREAHEVVGKSFFRQVAPCTAVRSFEGRWREFLSSSDETEHFHFTFPFPKRSVDVAITFVKAGAATFVLVRRRAGERSA